MNPSESGPASPFDGLILDALPDDATLLEMYRLASLVRTFEEGAERLHTEGQLSGPFHSSAGQEAVAVGVCLALSRDDLITSTHRGHGHLLAKGADPARMLTMPKVVPSVGAWTRA